MLNVERPAYKKNFFFSLSGKIFIIIIIFFSSAIVRVCGCTTARLPSPSSPPQHDYYTFSRTERPSDHHHVIILFCAASRAFSYLNNVVSCVCVCENSTHCNNKEVSVCVCCYTSKVSFFYLSVSFFAKPKSVIFKCPSRSRRRFSGFRSR